MRTPHLLAALFSLSAFMLARPSAAATFTLTPASPNKNPGPTLAVGGLPHLTTVSLYFSTGCTGALIQQKSTTLVSSAISFTAIPVTHNAITPLSVKIGAACSYSSSYRHDDIPPAAPVFSSIQGAGVNATLVGNAEPSAMVQLYSDAACSVPYMAAVMASSTGQFTVALPAGSPASVIRARATDAATNSSVCSPGWISWSPVHAEECPALPADEPVSRPPVYAFFDGGDHFFSWKDECQGSRATCPPNSPNDPYASGAFPYPSHSMSAYYAYLDLMKPAVVQSQGAGPGAVPIVWGQGPLGETGNGCDADAGAGELSCNGTPYAVYGHNTSGSVQHYQEIPYATPEQLQLRMGDLPSYLNDFGAIEFAPYVDFGTALMGEHVGRTGFWNFWDNHYDAYFNAGLVPEKKGDPTDWLLRLPSLNQDPGYVPTILELVFNYPYNAAKYAPYVRYSIDPLNPDFQRWQQAAIALIARSGHKRVMLDNTGIGNCWNADCATGFPAWADTQIPGGATAILRRPPASLYSDPGFETWARDTDPPFAYLVPGIPWNYGGCSSGATLSPSTDAYSGSYSGKFSAAAVGGKFETHTIESPTPALYHASFHYKSDYPILVKIYDNPNQPFISTTLPASGNWISTPDFAFSVHQGQHIATALIAQGAGTAYLDDLLLTPDTASGVPLPQPPVSSGLLAYSDPERSRFTLTEGYWRSRMTDVVLNLRQAGRAENPAFNLMLNNGGEQVLGADWSVVERTSDEIPRGMWDQGQAPGKYPAGSSFPDLDHPATPTVIAADTILTSLFTLRHASSRRLPAPFAYQLHAAKPDVENADTVLLRLAEGAAYAGGAGIDPNIMAQYYAYDTPTKWDAVNAPVPSFFQFTGQHPELYACLRYAAEVGVVYRAEGTNTPSSNARRKQVHLFEEISARGLTADVLGEGDITPARLSRLKVLVLDHAHRLSETEAATINGFVSSGGVAISTSDTGLLDDLGRTRDALPSTAWQLPAASASPLPNRIWLVQGADIAAADITTALTTASRPSPSAFDASIAAKLRIASWVSWDRLVVHLTNYEVPRGPAANLVQPLSFFPVTVPLPPDAPTPVPHHVDFWSPEGTMTSQSVIVNGNGTVTFTVPSLRVYTVASIH